MKKDETKNIDTDALIKKMQKQDVEYRKVTKALQIVFFVFIFLYAGFFIFNPLPKMSTMYHKVAGGCYVLAFMLFTYYFRKSYKKLKEVNYFEPVKKVLEDAELRYRFWQTKSYSIEIVIVIAMLFIGAGTFVIFYMAFKDKFTLMQILIGVQSIYIFVIGTSILIAYFAWVKEMKPTWLSIKKLLKEIEE
ncbi:MAG: hypothetical protein KAR57_05275 [Bacteroidales bacterium]|nr:hypothetical protein [Bacteroidales bacterium]